MVYCIKLNWQEIETLYLLFQDINLRRKNKLNRKHHSGRLKHRPVKSSRQQKRTDQRVKGPVPLESLIAYLYNKGTVSFKQLVKEFNLSRTKSKDFQEQLAKLCQHYLLLCSQSKQYKINKKEFPSGIITINPRGFGFVIPDEAGLNEGKDFFIAPRDIGPARHGDHVLLQLTNKKRGRLEARVIMVLKRGSARLVGTYTGARPGMVIPQDKRFPFTIIVRPKKSLNARDGEAVVVEIDDFQSEQNKVIGHIVEVLGDPLQTKVQMAMVIKQFSLPDKFPPEVLAEVKKITPRVDVTEDQQDLRHIPHITIDGETARDFDDGVAIEKNKAGFTLYVSIADVSHYVTPGSALDKEAYKRGTSVYFPTGVIPMLPERLSNGLCSLNPDEDRYAFTAILEFDRQGKRLKSRFTKSVIRSQARMTYNKVKKIVVDQDKETCDRYKKLLKPLKIMAELGRLLEKRRMKRGSIGFDMPEAGIIIGSDEQVENIVRRQRNLAHKIIEEFMLAANEAVAETFARRHFPALYRIHERPDELKVAAFAEFIQTLGFQPPAQDISPKWFNKVLSQAKGGPKEYIISNLLLRVMQQARYSPDNVGHFGLAAQYYTHFTSPIRRYPDLLVHRALQALITSAKPPSSQGQLKLAGEFLSTRERAATEAEWAMIDRLKVLYMADKTGEIFQAIISGASTFGLFVELTEIFVSGAVAMADLSEDYFHYEEKQHRLLGERGKIYQIGDLVQVKLVRVDMQRYKLDFAVVEAEKDNGTR
jgi:ribonuclease R